MHPDAWSTTGSAAPEVSHSEARPLVSVITIFLNAATFLAEAIESVRAQTYTHWELLLVDDGSSDGSATIAQRYVEMDARIRYFTHPGGVNRGLSASRNLGLRHAQGEYVAFLDADDVYRPAKLEAQVRLLVTHPSAAMVYGVTEHWFSWTGRAEDMGRDMPKRLGVRPETLVPPPRLVPLYLRKDAQTPGTSGFLVRREAALRVGGFDEAFRAMSEDAVFLYKIALQSDVYVEGGSWDRYRQHPDSLSNAMRRAGEYRSSGPNASRRRFLLWLEGYLRAQGIADADVWQALRQELRPYRNPLLYVIAELRYRWRKIRTRLPLIRR